MPNSSSALLLSRGDMPCTAAATDGRKLPKHDRLARSARRSRRSNVAVRLPLTRGPLSLSPSLPLSLSPSLSRCFASIALGLADQLSMMSNMAGSITASNDAKNEEVKKATTRQRRKSRDLGVCARATARDARSPRCSRCATLKAAASPRRAAVTPTAQYGHGGLRPHASGSGGVAL